MDCCGTDEKSEHAHDTNKMKGGKSVKMGKTKVENRIWLWVVIGALFIVVLFLVFKAGAGGDVVKSAGGAATSAAKTSAASSYGGMVGGC